MAVLLENTTVARQQQRTDGLLGGSVERISSLFPSIHTSALACLGFSCLLHSSEVAALLPVGLPGGGGGPGQAEGSTEHTL